MRRKKVTRRIISKRQWDSLVEKGIITFDGKDYIISLASEVYNIFKRVTAGKIEVEDYQLTAIECTKQMYSSFIEEEPHDVKVNDDYNPFEFSTGFYVPEWMFEDRQDDLVDMYKRYGKYKEEWYGIYHSQWA